MAEFGSLKLAGEIRASNFQAPYRTVGRFILSYAASEEAEIAIVPGEFDEIYVDQAQMGSEKERIGHKLECKSVDIGNMYC